MDCEWPYNIKCVRDGERESERERARQTRERFSSQEDGGAAMYTFQTKI